VRPVARRVNDGAAVNCTMLALRLFAGQPGRQEWERRPSCDGPARAVAVRGVGFASDFALNGPIKPGCGWWMHGLCAQCERRESPSRRRAVAAQENSRRRLPSWHLRPVPPGMIAEGTITLPGEGCVCLLTIYITTVAPPRREVAPKDRRRAKRQPRFHTLDYVLARPEQGGQRLARGMGRDRPREAQSRSALELTLVTNAIVLSAFRAIPPFRITHCYDWIILHLPGWRNWQTHGT
jgi:hypothetical protein